MSSEDFLSKDAAERQLATYEGQSFKIDKWGRRMYELYVIIKYLAHRPRHPRALRHD